MSNTEHEYKPLVQLIREGLKPGTVLEPQHAPHRATWNGKSLYWSDGVVTTPFNWEWRIVSEPPVEAEWEARVVNNAHGEGCIVLSPGHPFEHGDVLQVKAVKK